MFKEVLYKKTFDKIFSENYSRLHMYAYHITGNSEVSRDIVSDVFTGLWKNISSLDISKVNAYLMTSTRNRCIDHLRYTIQSDQYIKEYINCYSELYSDYSEELEKDKLVEQMLSQLPEQTRRILEMCYLQRKKYAEVAEELEISIDTVKKHVTKALKMLRDLYNTERNNESRTYK